MRPQTCLCLCCDTWLSCLPFESAWRCSPCRRPAQAESKVFGRMAPVAAALLLLPWGTLFAQQAQYPQQDWPPDQTPQSGYEQPGYQQPSYGQQQPYTQQPYAQQVPYAGQGYPQQGYAPAQPLSAEQLEQLVAPIALYPDALVAQMLAAATYPAQVVAADHWLQAQGYASADQIAAGADAQTWDPSVKALTAFPQVLAEMDRDLQWTTDLGNAYYNQPQDVLQMVQVMRQRAMAAGNLQNTPQETVSSNQGYIQLAPANPQMVYVPAYNPWDVYGQPVSPYPGFSLLGALGSFAGSGPVRFGLGIAMSAFTHTSFGWIGWGLDWLSQSVLFHHANYYSNSTTVARWRFPHPEQGAGGARAPAGRPQESFNRGYGAPGRRGYGYNGPAQQQFARQPDRYAWNRPGENPARPAPESGYRSQSQPMPTQPARPQTYGRPGYASGFYGRAPEAYGSRAGSIYGSPQQALRVPAPTPQRGYFDSRPQQPAAGRGFMESPRATASSGGFHPFGGGRGSEAFRSGERSPKSFKPGKESFKAPKSHGGGHSGGGHSGGHWFGGHHH